MCTLNLIGAIKRGTSKISILCQLELVQNQNSHVKSDCVLISNLREEL